MMIEKSLQDREGVAENMLGSESIKDVRSRIVSIIKILVAFNSSLTSKASRKAIEGLAILDDRVESL